MNALVLKRGLLVLALLVAVYAVLWYVQRPPKPPTPPTPPNPEPRADRPPMAPTERAPVPGRKVVIETDRGRMVAVLYEKDARVTAENFIALVKSGFYNGLVFHRVEPGFVIQTGDPTGTGSGGSEKAIPLEVSPNLKHDSVGVLGMARGNDLNSATSQFYITLNPTPDLDGRYAVFGRLVEGADVAGEIQKGDEMKKVYLLEPPPSRPGGAARPASEPPSP